MSNVPTQSQDGEVQNGADAEKNKMASDAGNNPSESRESGPTPVPTKLLPPPPRGMGASKTKPFDPTELLPDRGRRNAGYLTTALDQQRVGLTQVNDQDRQLLIDRVRHLLNDAIERNHNRDQAAYAKLLHSIDVDNTRAAEVIDKAQRLDEGSATEVYSFGAIEFSGNKQLSDAVTKANPREGTPAKMVPINTPPSRESYILEAIPRKDGDSVAGE